VLWRKLPGARSAGRVQSVALRLVCDRELEIEKFVRRNIGRWSRRWRRRATRRSRRGSSAPTARKLQRLDIGSGAEAEAFKQALETAAFTVAAVEAKPVKRHPQPPFTTSTLQQEASRKLGFAPAHTMRVAQRLYEGVDIGGETVGLITYMRTDGVQIADEAITAVRRVIEADYGAKYVPRRRAATRPRPRTRRKPTRPSVRPTSPAGRARPKAFSIRSSQAL
jgi:DNA topoisomerase-1